MPSRLRPRNLPLRVTLVAAVVVLSVLGLVVSGFIVTSALQRSLVDRLDAQLHEASRGWARPRDDLPRLPPPEPSLNRPPSDFYVRVLEADGQVRFVIDETGTTPEIPTDPEPGPQTVGSVGDDGALWRILTVANSSNGEVVTVGIEMSELEDTVSNLVALQASVGGLVVLVLGGAGYLTVSRSLRPLRDVEETAAAIASGDLHRRVPEREPNTEVGSLAVSLNAMLTQIQQAFAATEASEAAARRSEETMRQFVADASHELRTPLTSIKGFAELYRQGALTDSGHVVGRIEGEASRMGVLVEDLLILASLDAQRPLEHKSVDLLGVASDAVHSARASAPNRMITLTVFDGPGVPEVVGDAQRLRQVLSNVIGNAVKHTPAEASVTVRVGTEGADAVLEVADTGPGLSAAEAARVFERFYRTDASRSRESGGTGLGLSIVQSLVHAHGGQVTVRSAPGEGAVFTVRLPRAQA